MYMFSVYVHVHEYEYTCAYICMWKPKDNLRCHSSHDIYLDFLAWSLPSRLGCLASESQRPICLYFPSAEIRSTPLQHTYFQLFCIGSWDETQVLKLTAKLSPQAIALFLYGRNIYFIFLYSANF